MHTTDVQIRNSHNTYTHIYTLMRTMHTRYTYAKGGRRRTPVSSQERQVTKFRRVSSDGKSSTRSNHRSRRRGVTCDVHRVVERENRGRRTKRSVHQLRPRNVRFVDRRVVRASIRDRYDLSVYLVYSMDVGYGVNVLALMPTGIGGAIRGCKWRTREFVGQRYRRKESNKGEREGEKEGRRSFAVSRVVI